MIAILYAVLGHVYLQHEPATVLVRTEAVEWDWRVADWQGREVASGRGPEPIRLPTDTPGWFTLAVRAGEAAASSRFAVFTEFDLSDVADSPFGVMTHCSADWNPDVLEIFAKAGIKHVRDEVQWGHVETQKGVYEFPEKCEAYMRMLADRRQMPLVPLTFGNPNYDFVEGVPVWASAPYTDAGFNGYAEYALAVLRHYGDQIKTVEIWNEYNGGFARGPADGKPEVYAEMLRRTYQAIKRERPDVLVLAGDTIGIPLDWLESVIQCAGNACFDGISVHPYGYLLTPEHHVRKLEALRALIRKYNDGKDKPIWVTEQGWYTTAPGEHGNRDPITELTQAQYLVRAWTLFLAHGVEKAFWYLGRDDKSFGTMGLVGSPDDPRGAYAPKMALVAYATLVRQLDGMRFVERDATDPVVHCYRFANAGSSVSVVWATRPVQVRLPPVSVTDLMGVERRLSGPATLDGTPVFVRGNLDGLEMLSIAPAPEWPEPDGVRIMDCARRTIRVDGDLSDWQGIAGVGLMDGSYVRLTGDRTGDDDLGGEAWLCRDDDNLYFAARIRDDVHDNTHHGCMGWKGDNIQLGFSPAMPWTGGEWSEPWLEFGLNLGSKGAEFYGLASADVAIRRDEQAGTTVYEAAMPWKELAPDGGGPAGAFSFGIYVNDADGAGRKGFWKWADIKCVDKMQAFRPSGE
jgi:hypothetical protein